jgi:GNAT superfamily N-acetyltransferase
MTEGYSVEVARPGDGREIISLIRECFTEHERSLVIMGCEGADRFVEETIRYQSRGGDSVFLVARDQEILSFIQVRRLKEAVSFIYGATSPRARGRGVFRRLFGVALELGQSEGARMEVHDVFVGNGLGEFYKRIEFRVTGRTTWRATPLAGGNGGLAVLIGLPQADASHERFGFSQFTLVTGRGQYTVGRLGRRWFHSRSRELLDDPDAQSALSRLDPDRDLLILLPAAVEWPAGVDAQIVMESDHFEGEIETVLRALRGNG